MTTFTGPGAFDLLLDAEARREPLALTVDQVSDLVETLPDEDEHLHYDDIVERLAKVDVKALKVSRKAREAIAAAFGYDVDDIWPA